MKTDRELQRAGRKRGIRIRNYLTLHVRKSSFLAKTGCNYCTALAVNYGSAGTLQLLVCSSFSVVSKANMTFKRYVTRAFQLCICVNSFSQSL